MSAGLRAVIVDDEEPARERVRRLLKAHPDVELVGEAADVAAAVELIDRETPDVCFLDVRIPGGDGFEVLRRVRQAPRVIFTTAYDEYAVRAFEVHSVDYLLKPFRAERFAAALARARDAAPRPAAAAEDLERIALEAGGSFRVPARRGSRIVLLDPQAILWFEAEAALVFARTADGRYLVERSLADLEQALGTWFFRAHRRYLVRLDRIAEIRPGEGGTHRLLVGGDGGSIPLSRRQARRLRERMPW